MLNLDLFERIVPDACKFTVSPVKIEIKMRKADPSIKWSTLEAPAQAPAVVQKWEDSSNVQKHVYPSSRPAKVNWDEVAKAETADEKDEGDPLQRLFQQIYSGGSEEQRRAMMKSFVRARAGGVHG